MYRTEPDTVYMVVTADKYELPMAVFFHAYQAAAWLGCSKATVLSMITRGQTRRKGFPSPCRIIRFKEAKK